ncbi:MAG TPA: response regulator transcription factor [Anaerolineales bacterium]|nr:response regulator transcription factor [Anaerolineales bacterium]
MPLANGLETLTEDTGKRVSITDSQIKVLIVDDHPGVRAGIKNLIEGAKDIVVTGEGANGADAIQLINTTKSDILLLDIELPDQRGDRVMHNIHEVQPRMKVLAVSSYSDREYILGMVQNGAAGYITKDEAPVMLLGAIRIIVRDGKDWLSPRAIKNSRLSSLEEQMLTEREVHILKQLLRNQSQVQIANSLQMEEKQLEKYLKLLLRKFEAESIEVLKYAAQRILARYET